MIALSRPKSTGKHSENNHFLGHVADIMSQLQLFGVSRMVVAYAILEMEAEGLDDWPTEEGRPKSWAKATSDDAALAIERAHHFADFYGLYLTEYDKDKRAYRVLLGERIA